MKQYEGKICICGHEKERHGIDGGMCKVAGCPCNEFRRCPLTTDTSNDEKMRKVFWNNCINTIEQLIKEKETERTYEIIQDAKKHIDEDPHLSNYILRDLNVLKEAGLADLSWSMHKDGCVKEDVEYLISQLEKYLQKDAHDIVAKRNTMEVPEINITMNRQMADDLLLFVKQIIIDVQNDLNTVNPEDKLLVGVWKNGLKFWNDIKDTIIYAQDASILK